MKLIGRYRLECHTYLTHFYKLNQPFQIDGIFLCVTYQLYVSVFFLSKEGCNSMMSLYFFRLQFTARMKKLTTSAVIGRKKKPQSIPNPGITTFLSA
nr:hypothetical protein Iba_scaffold25037CG0120 [Ipomoea batatas]